MQRVVDRLVANEKATAMTHKPRVNQLFGQADVTTLKMGGDEVTASGAEVNRATDVSSRLVNLTA